jgi:class 3 adenylate cyclase
MALDENGTVAALDAARRTFRTHVESNRGRVIDMVGDSVLAVFDSATGAVSAALALRRRSRRPRARCPRSGGCGIASASISTT